MGCDTCTPATLSQVPRSLQVKAPDQQAIFPASCWSRGVSSADFSSQSYVCCVYQSKVLTDMAFLQLLADLNKKFELMLTRRAKAYSSSCSQTVSLSPAILSQFIRGVRCSRWSQKSIKTPYFGSLGSFKVIDVDTTEKLVTSACCDR